MLKFKFVHEVLKGDLYEAVKQSLWIFADLVLVCSASSLKMLCAKAIAMACNQAADQNAVAEQAFRLVWLCDSFLACARHAFQKS